MVWLRRSLTSYPFRYAYNAFSRRLLAETRTQGSAAATHTLYLYEAHSFAPLAQLVDEADPSAAQTPPTPAIHLPAANDDSADWNSRHAKEQFQQRMQSQTRHIRRQTRNATQATQARSHIPAIVEETQPRRWHIRYYHNDQIGTPRELTSEAGEILWRATY